MQGENVYLRAHCHKAFSRPNRFQFEHLLFAFNATEGVLETLVMASGVSKRKAVLPTYDALSSNMARVRKERGVLPLDPAKDTRIEHGQLLDTNRKA